MQKHTDFYKMNIKTALKFRKVTQILMVFFCLTATAQKMPFEKLDSLSQNISRLVKATDRMLFVNEGTPVTLGYPEDTFVVYASNRSAMLANYFTVGDDDFLYLIENADLSKATGISLMAIDANLGEVKLFYPKNYLKAVSYKDGKVFQTGQPDALEFYVKLDPTKSSDDNFHEMFFAVYDLTMALKAEKKLVTAEQAALEKNDYLILKPAEFIAKYPNSILIQQVKQNLEGEKEALKKAQVYLDEFAAGYGFKLGQPIAEFRKLDSTMEKKLNSSNEESTSSYGNTPLVKYYVIGKKANFYDDAHVYFDKQDQMFQLLYTLKVSGSTLNSTVGRIKKNIPESCFVNNYDKSVTTIMAPDKSYKISFYSNFEGIGCVNFIKVE